MGKRYIESVNIPEAAGESVMDHAAIFGVRKGDIRDYMWTFQFTMSSGSADLQAQGPAGDFTDYRTGLVSGDVVQTLPDEAFSAYKAVWTGTSGSGELDAEGEERP